MNRPSVFTQISADWRPDGSRCPQVGPPPPRALPAIEAERGYMNTTVVEAVGDNRLSIALMLGQTGWQS